MDRLEIRRKCRSQRSVAMEPACMRVCATAGTTALQAAQVEQWSIEGDENPWTWKDTVVGAQKIKRNL